MHIFICTRVCCMNVQLNYLFVDIFMNESECANVYACVSVCMFIYTFERTLLVIVRFYLRVCVTINKWPTAFK